MKTRIVSACAAAVIAAWASHGWARETVNLPVTSVFGAEGQLNGVDTTGAGTLNVGNNQNINTNNDAGGAVTSNANNTATITFGGGSTVTGFVGSNGVRFLVINAGATGTTVNFNGAVFSTAFNVTGTGTVNFNGNTLAAAGLTYAGDGFVSLGAGLTLTGAIFTNTANTGTLTLGGASSVVGAVGGANGLRQINVVGGNAAITGSVQALGFSLGANTLAITGALTTNAGSTIATTLASNAVFGRISPTGASNINAAGITVIPTVTGVLTTGTNFRIVNGLVGPLGVPVLVINNNPIYTFTGLPTTTGDVNILLVSQTPLSAIVTAPLAAAVGPILDAPAPAGTDLRTVQDAIFALPSAAALNNALSQLAPAASNLAAPRVAAQAAHQFDDLLLARMEEIQDVCCDGCEPNKAQANTRKCSTPQKRSNWWGKAYASTGTQDDVNGVSGYKTDAKGVILAYDVPVGDRTRAGVAAGFSDSTIDGNNTGGRTEIDSYQLTGYVSHAPGPWFFQGALSVGADRYDGSRSIVFPGVNRGATAEHSGTQLGALVRAGTRLYSGGNTITPFASLQYSRVNVGAHTEQGAGDISLRVERQKYDFLQSALGVKAERVIQSSNGAYAPEVHFKWLHEFGDTTMRQTATFAGGGGSFASQGVKQDRDMYNLGAGFTFLPCDCDTRKAWTVKALYDYKWTRNDYSSHQLSVLASIKW